MPRRIGNHKNLEKRVREAERLGSIAYIPAGSAEEEDASSSGNSV